MDTNYFFASDDPLDILGVLNSKLITWWINSEDTPIGNGGAYRHYKYNIERLHFPTTIREILKPFVADILSGKNTKQNITQINEIVYQLYNLSEDEIAYIEG